MLPRSQDDRAMNVTLYMAWLLIAIGAVIIAGAFLFADQPIEAGICATMGLFHTHYHRDLWQQT